MALPNIFEPFQMVSGLLWALLVLGLAWLFSTRGKDRVLGGEHFLPGLAIRMLGGMLFGLTYYSYFGGGDTFEYFRATEMMAHEIRECPRLSLSYLFASPGEEILPNHPFFTQKATLWVIKTATPISLLSGDSYWAITVVFSLLSFLGCWLFYQAMVRLWPGSRRYSALAILGIPSVIFWGSGFLKDSLSLGLLGMIAYATLNLWHFQHKKLLSLFLLLAGLTGLFILKFYIALLWVAAAGLMAFREGLKLIKSRTLKRILLGTALGLLILLAYAFPQIPEKLLTYHNWHMLVLEGRGAGSSYSLGELPLSWWGLLKAFPLATLTALCGPFFWQWTHPLIALAGIESLLILGLVFWYLSQHGLKKGLSRIWNSPLLLMFLAFSLGGFFIAGLFGQNFGSTVRYRMPFLPFFLLVFEVPAGVGNRKGQS